MNVVRSAWGIGESIGQPGEIPEVDGLENPKHRISSSCEIFNASEVSRNEEFFSGAYFIYFDTNNIVEFVYFGKT